VTLGLAAAALVAPQRFPDVEPTAWHVFASLAFIQHLNPQGLPFPLLPPGWTLNYEAVFYLLFAASLLLPLARRAMALTLVLAGLTFCGFLYPPAYIMLANPLLLEFAAGVWLARFMEEGLVPGRHTGWALFVCGLASFGAMHLAGVEWDLWRPLFWGVPAFLLVAGLTAVEQDGGLPQWRLPKALGDASYSIYLCHPLTVGAVAVAFGAANPWVFVPLAGVVGTAVGWLVWRLVEVPALAVLRRPASPAAVRLA